MIAGTGVVLILSLASPVNAEISPIFEKFTVDGTEYEALSSPEHRAAVNGSLSYWNALTKGTVSMPVYFGEIYYEAPYVAFSFSSDEKQRIVFNTYYNYMFKGETPTQTSSDLSVFSLTAHELGHNMGIVVNYKDYNQLSRPSDGLWSSLILDTEGNGIDGLWFYNAPQGSETLDDKLLRGVRYTFTGKHASAVNGDVWMGGSKEDSPVAVEAGYQFSYYAPGSTLYHPYTRFGLMNSLIEGWRPFFSEVELAIFRDLGQTVDIEGQFGRSVYTNNNTVTNNHPFSSTNMFGIGLHIVGDNNAVTQTGNLYANGIAGAGIRIEGIDNKVTIAPGTTITANGVNGIGVLASHGTGAHLINRGIIEATGEGGVGVFFNNDWWSDAVYNVRGGAKQFDNSGTIHSGTNNAIYLGGYGPKDPLTINFMNGSRVMGHISTSGMINKDILLTFGKLPDADGAATSAPDPSAVMMMTGNITGSNYSKPNVFSMHVLGGRLYYTGTATLGGATIDKGAELFGNAAYNLTQLTNHGTLSPVISAGIPGTITVNGNLISDGSLGVAAYYDKIGKITVTGNANVTGSRVVSTDDSLYLPDQSYEFLQAGTITGAVQGGAFTGFLNAEVTNSEKTITVTTALADNLGVKSSRQQQAYEIMRGMYKAARPQDMAKLFSLKPVQAKEALTTIYGGAQLNQAALIQSDGTVRNAVAARLASLPYTMQQEVTYRPAGFAPGTMEIKAVIPLELDPGNSWWIKTGRVWGSAAAQQDVPALKNQNFSVVLGQDRKVDKNWRTGVLLAYSKNATSSSIVSTTSQSYDLGLYGGYNREAFDLQTFLSYGKQSNEARRYLHWQGMIAGSDYRSTALTFGLGIKYNLHHDSNKLWQISPYAETQITRYNQNGYSETGAGSYNQMADKLANIYSTGEIGLLLSRSIPGGRYGLSAGYKKVLSGHDPAMTIAFSGNPQAKMTISGSEQDKEYLVLGFNIQKQVAKDWTITGQMTSERGQKSDTLSASLRLQKIW